MTKREELDNPMSCLNKAQEGEAIFVLLGRDFAAPFAIEEWIAKRIEFCLNSSDDPKILEAKQTIERMRAAQVRTPARLFHLSECNQECTCDGVKTCTGHIIHRSGCPLAAK